MIYAKTECNCPSESTNIDNSMPDEKYLTESEMWAIFERSAFTDKQIEKIGDTTKSAFYAMLKKERVIERFISLEETRSNNRWIIGILLLMIVSLLAYIKL